MLLVNDQWQPFKDYVEIAIIKYTFYYKYIVQTYTYKYVYMYTGLNVN